MWNIVGSLLGWIMSVCKRPSNQSYLVAHTRDDTLLLALMLWSTTLTRMFISNIFDLSLYFWMSCLYLLDEVGKERWRAKEAALPWTYPVCEWRGDSGVPRHHRHLLTCLTYQADLDALTEICWEFFCSYRWPRHPPLKKPPKNMQHQLLGSNHFIVPPQSPKTLQSSPWWFLLQLNDVSLLLSGPMMKDFEMFALLYLASMALIQQHRKSMQVVFCAEQCWIVCDSLWK